MTNIKHSIKCRAKNRAYCRYHGVPQPSYYRDLQEKMEDLNHALRREHEAWQHFVGEEGQKQLKDLQEQKRNVAIELAALMEPVDSEEAKHFLRENNVLVTAADLKRAVKNRDRANKAYLRQLAEEVFQDKDQMTVALKGNPAFKAYAEAVQARYPVVEEPYTTDGTFYVPGTDKLFDARVEKLEKWSADRGLSVIKARVGVMGVARVPYDWSSYGVTEERYNQLKQDSKFQKSLTKFRKAQSDVRLGLPVSIS